MGKLIRDQTRFDSRPIPESMAAARFIDGPNETVTPEAAYKAMTGGTGNSATMTRAFEAMTAGEGTEATAARARMLARRGLNKEPCSSEAAREKMIHGRGGKR